MTPVRLFESWLADEVQQSTLELPFACCLSTIGTDGYPNSRFVSLKEVFDDSFVVTGPTDARKGIEVAACSRVALAFWWTATMRQVRIQGDASIMPAAKTDEYFEQRNRESKIVSTVFEQGKKIDGPVALRELFAAKTAELADLKLTRPENWGGLQIKPIRIELMEFKKSRLHERSLYELVDDRWEHSTLQP